MMSLTSINLHKRIRIKDLFFAAFMGLSLVGCDQTSDQSSEIKQDRASNVSANQRLVSSTKNSDGTLTHISAVTVCMDAVPKDAQIQDCSFSGSALHFYVEGENYVSIDEKSLQVDKLEINAHSILKNRKQEDNFELGSFPRVSDNGQYIQWSVKVPTGLDRITDNFSIVGTVKAHVSNELSTKVSEPFDIYEFESFQLGPIVVEGVKGDTNTIDGESYPFKELESLDLESMTEEEVKDLAESMGVSVGEILGDVISGVFKGISNDLDNNSGTVEIVVKADFAIVERLELLDGDIKMSSQGWSGWENERTYTFNKPKSPNVTLKLYYWLDAMPVTLNFNF